MFASKCDTSINQCRPMDCCTVELPRYLFYPLQHPGLRDHWNSGVLSLGSVGVNRWWLRLAQCFGLVASDLSQNIHDEASIVAPTHREGVEDGMGEMILGRRICLVATVALSLFVVGGCGGKAYSYAADWSGVQVSAKVITISRGSQTESESEYKAACAHPDTSQYMLSLEWYRGKSVYFKGIVVNNGWAPSSWKPSLAGLDRLGVTAVQLGTAADARDIGDPGDVVVLWPGPLPRLGAVVEVWGEGEGAWTMTYTTQPLDPLVRGQYLTCHMN